MIKNKILLNNTDNIIKLSLDNSNISDNDELINSSLSEISNNFINDNIDYEKYIYKSNNSDNYKINMYFNNYLTYINNITTFTENELNMNYNVIQNSFYILNYYSNDNDFNNYNIFSMYVTKLGIKPEYIVNKSQFKNLYIPNWFIDIQNDNIVSIYVKISLYNAKTGKLLLFSDKKNNLYFKINVDILNKTWKFNINNNLNVYYYDNSSYNDKINNKLNVENKFLINYPNSKIYDIINGKFI